jgi:flagellar hook-length control protein FliK
MMIPSSVGTLDIKGLSQKPTKKSSKEEGGAFENEMIESEKRMKRKTKIDGREGVAHSQSSSRNHASKNNDNEEKTQERKTTRGAANSPSMAKSALKKNLEQTPAQAQNIENPVEQAAPNALDAEGILQEMFLTSENPLEAQTTAASLGKNGSISLQGLQMVTPQLMTESDPSTTSVSGDGANTESLLSITPSLEKNTANFASQDSEQNLNSFNFSSDFSPLQNTMTKETGNTNQVFASILDAKTQNVDQVKQANVENLVTQASAILKDGGGEMKLQLRPEGMGTVDVKVGVQNGQVSIEILTQDQNIKRMFEDSVLDIRNALEIQNLKVDAFNVGVSENFDQSAAQQNASQFAEREFARNFMGQFRDDRQALRQQGLDSMINNRSPFSSQPEGLSPAATPKGLNNGRLNIIA